MSAARPSAPARALGATVRGYQRLVAGRPSPCRYVPSCSTYALEAVEAHGARRGAWLAARRLLRCHPWGGHGLDPVPEPRRRRTDRSEPAPPPDRMTAPHTKACACST